MKLVFTIISGLLMVLNSGALAEPTSSPRGQLKESIEQLQKTPDDAALREKIIKLAKKVKPAPVVPEEARRAFVRGNTAFSEAKGPEDYARAIQRYDEALLVAPWWRDPYFNLAKSLELQKEYGRAIQSIKLFLLTGPSADDARKAQDYSYALEDKQEKLVKMKSDQEAVVKRGSSGEQSDAELIRSLDGAVFVDHWDTNREQGDYLYQISGGNVIMTLRLTGGNSTGCWDNRPIYVGQSCTPEPSVPLNGRRFSCYMNTSDCEISPDGKSVFMRRRTADAELFRTLHRQ